MFSLTRLYTDVRTALVEPRVEAGGSRGRRRTNSRRDDGQPERSRPADQGHSEQAADLRPRRVAQLRRAFLPLERGACNDGGGVREARRRVEQDKSWRQS